MRAQLHPLLKSKLPHIVFKTNHEHSCLLQIFYFPNDNADINFIKQIQANKKLEEGYTHPSCANGVKTSQKFLQP